MQKKTVSLVISVIALIEAVQSNSKITSQRSISRIYHYLELKALVLLVVQKHLTELLQRERYGLVVAGVRVDHLNLQGLLLHVSGFGTRDRDGESDDLLRTMEKQLN